MFLIEYPSRGWDNFFDIFLSLCQSQENCNLFLRILLQINADVADREISHTPKVYTLKSIIISVIHLAFYLFIFNVLIFFRNMNEIT